MDGPVEIDKGALDCEAGDELEQHVVAGRYEGVVFDGSAVGRAVNAPDEPAVKCDDVEGFVVATCRAAGAHSRDLLRGRRDAWDVDEHARLQPALSFANSLANQSPELLRLGAVPARTATGGSDRLKR